VIRFVIDGAEWRFDGWTLAQITEALERLLDRVDVASERDESVVYGDDLFHDRVLGEQSVWEMLEEPTFAGVKERMTAAFMRMPCWSEIYDWPPVWEVCISGSEPTTNPDVAFVHVRNQQRQAVACLGLRRSGPLSVAWAEQSVDVHWVTDEPTHVGFFRAAIDVEGDSEETLERLAPHAFPALHFLPAVWHGLGAFQGGYHRVRMQLRRHLTVYADHGYWIFTTEGTAITPTDTPTGSGAPSNQVVERRFLTHGLEVSPEKPNVREHGDCRRARERVIGGRTLYCHWHGKLESHTNRIHLHQPVPESDDRLVIAIFHQHLPLPS
jgi:hypothetical protein